MTDDTQRKETLRAWIGDHQGLISRVIRAWAFTADDREDLTQEIGLQLWESIPRFKSESAVSTWVYRVSLYAAMAWSRREVRYKDRAQDLEHIPVPEEREEDGRVGWLYAEIARLGDVDRSLALLLLEGWSYREIAASLGISEKNASVRIHRMKKLLAKRFEEGQQHGI